MRLSSDNAWRVKEMGKHRGDIPCRGQLLLVGGCVRPRRWFGVIACIGKSHVKSVLSSLATVQFHVSCMTKLGLCRRFHQKILYLNDLEPRLTGAKLSLTHINDFHRNQLQASTAYLYNHGSSSQQWQRHISQRDPVLSHSSSMAQDHARTGCGPNL